MGETLQIRKRICTTEEASHLLELLRATYQTLGPETITESNGPVEGESGL
jgi:predicted ATPase